MRGEVFLPLHMQEEAKLHTLTPPHHQTPRPCIVWKAPATKTPPVKATRQKAFLAYVVRQSEEPPFVLRAHCESGEKGGKGIVWIQELLRSAAARSDRSASFN
jgi:hypothetical protein